LPDSESLARCGRWLKAQIRVVGHVPAGRVDFRLCGQRPGLSLMSENIRNAKRAESLMSAMGHKRTLRGFRHMSALLPKADIAQRKRRVRCVPKAVGNKSTGTWKLNAKGFCTTWNHSKSNCFTIVPSGENKWLVQGNRNHHRNYSCCLVKINIRAIWLANTANVSFGS
jgi:hypothetical protein